MPSLLMLLLPRSASFPVLRAVPFLLMLMAVSLNAAAASRPADSPPMPRVKVKSGRLEGMLTADNAIQIFKGVPFAAPPVGTLRWREPQPVPRWKGVRPATTFGPRAMQLPLYKDMNFRSGAISEDCLYLNVWAPVPRTADRAALKPVLVYFHGGGFQAGDGSELRYDGESMARRGIVTVTVNYRLGVFGFLAHPALKAETKHQTTGNYGFLDQNAALRWVQQNIAAFGGDPQRVTIGGESAGSISVSAQMASPLSKGLFIRAIGESGALIGSSFGPIPMADAETRGVAFATKLGTPTLAALRALPAQQLLDSAGKAGMPRFAPVIDGYFFPQTPLAAFTAGQQARVPLLVGWNSLEMNASFLLSTLPPTPDNVRATVQKLYGPHADAILALYPTNTPEAAAQSADDLAGDRFIVYSTWKWADLHARTSGQPVYRYLFTRPRPQIVGATSSTPAPPPGAVHSAEIEYALGNLDTNKVFAWTDEDKQVSATMQRYFERFILTGNPNAQPDEELRHWPQMQPNEKAQIMRLNVKTGYETEAHRDRYLLLDQLQQP